jgi:hypothetical protein
VDVTPTLHLVRGGVAPLVADDDWIVYLEPMRLAPHGTPPLPPGPLDHDQLVVLVFAAGRVVTW